jgi:hypothetical protein
MSLTLPPLVAPSHIESDHVLAAGVIYAAFQLEQLVLFRVTDRIVEMFEQGRLSLGRTAGDRLMKYVRTANLRLSEAERRALYDRTLGLGGRQQGPQSNRDFDRLWSRFLSAVTARRTRARSLSPTRPRSLSQAHIRKTGRDLAANLSLHGYGIGYFAAARLRAHTTASVSLLSLAEIRAAFGARDLWQVIDIVSRNELGGARNVVRYRTLATNGLVIIRWLAGLAGRRGRSGSRPSDAALLEACEAWLAAAVSPDE